MGAWHIHIEGHGQHHNGVENDADAMTKAFVSELRAKGHRVDRAELTLTGQQQDLDSGATLDR